MIPHPPGEPPSPFYPHQPSHSYPLLSPCSAGSLALCTSRAHAFRCPHEESPNWFYLLSFKQAQVFLFVVGSLVFGGPGA